MTHILCTCGHSESNHFPDPPTTQLDLSIPRQPVRVTRASNGCKLCKCTQFQPAKTADNTLIFKGGKLSK